MSQLHNPAPLMGVVDARVPDEEGCQDHAVLTAVEMFGAAPQMSVYAFASYRGLLERGGSPQVTRHGSRPVSARKPG